MRNLFSEEMAQRLNVTLGTLHKRSFQLRTGLPIRKLGKRIFCPEPVWDAWVLEKAGVSPDAQTE